MMMIIMKVDEGGGLTSDVERKPAAASDDWDLPAGQ